MRFVERVAEPRSPSASPPLLVLMHGIGADENDLFPVARFLDARLKIVSLRGPYAYSGGASWFHIDFPPGGGVVPDVAQARASLRQLVDWLAAVPARLGTDPARTFVLGFSQGAMMSLGLLRTVPGRLAGVMALSGRFPGTLFDTAAAPDAIARVPVLVAHGLYDDVLPIDHGRAIRDALAPVVRDFTYEEFPVAHGIIDDEIRLLADWLAKRV
jgi:phospholipase/carboxylesterase